MHNYASQREISFLLSKIPPPFGGDFLLYKGVRRPHGLNISEYYRYIDITNQEPLMPVIKPISDLRNKANEISQLAHDADEPIFITKNGEGDLVVMSLTHYAKMQKKLELLNKLSVAQAQHAAGDPGKPLTQAVRDIRKRLRASA
jgi:prevent-host-death family protein